MSYKKVNTPVNFPELEKTVREFWDKNGIFEKSVSSRPESKSFTFFEGPPTANGKPGIHHVIARGIKDFVCRYRTMQGYRVGRKAGWDTHGLPVEIEVEKVLGFDSKDQIEAYGVDKFNQKCRDSVFTYLQEWNEMTRRIGYWVDLENPYITYTNDYIETVWWILAQLWKKDLLYRGFKILPYCPRCETALSSHEISLGYKEVKDRSITAKFPLKEGENRFILAWTTTPWTLPGNVALAVGADIDYVEVQQDYKGTKEFYYLAENRLEMLKGEYQVLRKFKGSDLQGWEYRPLFDFMNLADDDVKAYYVTVADFVTTEDGTGVVHTAVMYGEDDYRLGVKIGLPARHTVDEQGHFNELVPPWQGQFVKDHDVEQGIIDHLLESGRLYRTEKYTHSYPHCWRCDSPLLYYAKKSWYLKTTAVREQLMENNKKITWYPKEVGTGRFGQWLENNVDWAISRDRYWGTPLNVWVCDECEKQQAVESVEELKSLSGRTDIDDLHKPYIDEVSLACPECGGAMHRTPEVIDCWFDSGAMPFAQQHYPFGDEERFNANFPADFIAEGVDQTRGWFYSLLAIATMLKGETSYKSCMSIELILDKKGQKMSKSKGNSVNPFSILDNEGADPLRWYLFTVSPPWVPTRFDREGVGEVQRKFFGTLANTYGFFVLYANIDEFSYGEKIIPVEKRAEIDRWLVSARNSLVKKVDRLLQRLEVTKAARAIQEFVIDDLSNWYVRRNRRRFWKSEMGDDKRAAYQTLHETLFALSKMIAPFAPFLSEDIYQNLNVDGLEEWESVHLSFYPSPDDAQYQYAEPDLEARMNMAREVVSLCHSARNDAAIKVRQPLGRAVVVTSSQNQASIQKLEDVIKDEINVYQLEFGEDASGLMQKRAKPIFKKLGPKFGSHVNQAAEVIRGFSPHEIDSLEKGAAVHVSLDKGKHAEVVLEDVELYTEAVAGMVVQTGATLTVALDTSLTEELVHDGMAREFVNRVQNMRKEAGFDVTDRIHVYYDASPALKQAVARKADYIKEEILADGLNDAFTPGEYHQEWTFDKETVNIGIQRV